MRPQDFLEGVREAAACFYDAVAAGDDATLARMASERVRKAVAQDMKMLAAVHGIQVRRAGGARSAFHAVMVLRYLFLQDCQMAHVPCRA